LTPRLILIHTTGRFAGLYQICGTLDQLGITPDALSPTATMHGAWPRQDDPELTAALVRVGPVAVYYRELPAADLADAVNG
jgi:hypothetical protein